MSFENRLLKTCLIKKVQNDVVQETTDVVQETPDVVQETPDVVQETPEEPIKEPEQVVQEIIKEPEETVKEPEETVKEIIKEPEEATSSSEESDKKPVKKERAKRVKKVIEEIQEQAPMTTEDRLKSMENELILIKNTLTNIIKNKDKQIECNLELIQRLIYERLAIEPSLVKDTSKVETKKPENTDTKAHIKIKKTENNFHLTGSTYDHKDKIKTVGGIWSTNDKTWIIHVDYIDDLTNIFKEHNVSYEISL